MIGLGKGTRVVVWSHPTDMRKSFHTLSGLVTSFLGQDPLSGTLFLFVAKNAKRAKLIWWDGTGFCLFQKRLAKGRFAAPWLHLVDESVVISSSQLALFFDGSPLAFMSVLCEEIQPQKITTQMLSIR